MADKAKRLSEYGDFASFGNSISAEDVEGDELKVTDVHFVTGKLGEYAFISAVTEPGELITVRCGGTLILEALHKVLSANAFPVQLKLVKRGRAWIAE
jgi:hypothetical protein